MGVSRIARDGPRFLPPGVCKPAPVRKGGGPVAHNCSESDCEVLRQCLYNARFRGASKRRRDWGVAKRRDWGVAKR